MKIQKRLKDYSKSRHLIPKPSNIIKENDFKTQN